MDLDIDELLKGASEVLEKSAYFPHTPSVSFGDFPQTQNRPTTIPQQVSAPAIAKPAVSNTVVQPSTPNQLPLGDAQYTPSMSLTSSPVAQAGLSTHNNGATINTGTSLTPSNRDVMVGTSGGGANLPTPTSTQSFKEREARYYANNPNTLIPYQGKAPTENAPLSVRAASGMAADPSGLATNQRVQATDIYGHEKDVDPVSNALVDNKETIDRVSNWIDGSAKILTAPARAAAAVATLPEKIHDATETAKGWYDKANEIYEKIKGLTPGGGWGMAAGGLGLLGLTSHLFNGNSNRWGGNTPGRGQNININVGGPQSGGMAPRGVNSFSNDYIWGQDKQGQEKQADIITDSLAKAVQTRLANKVIDGALNVGAPQPVPAPITKKEVELVSKHPEVAKLLEDKENQAYLHKLLAE